MTMAGRRELTNVLRARYALANKSGKSRILDEFVATTDYRRKYAISLLNQPPRQPAPKRRRPPPAGLQFIPFGSPDADLGHR
jgi:hypothetical protein